MEFTEGMFVGCWDLMDRHPKITTMGIGKVVFGGSRTTGFRPVVEMIFPFEYKGQRIKFGEEALVEIPVANGIKIDSLSQDALDDLARVLRAISSSNASAFVTFKVKFEILPTS